MTNLTVLLAMVETIYVCLMVICLIVDNTVTEQVAA